VTENPIQLVIKGSKTSDCDYNLEHKLLKSKTLTKQKAEISTISKHQSQHRRLLSQVSKMHLQNVFTVTMRTVTTKHK